MIDNDGFDTFWEAGSTSSEEESVPPARQLPPPPPPPPPQLCACGVRVSGLELPQHILSDWHSFNMKRKTASLSTQLHRGPVTLEAYEQWAARPRLWHSKTGRIRKAPPPPPAASTTATAATTTATSSASVPPAVHRQLSWSSSTDVLEEVLRVVELDPLSEAAAVCTSWREVLSRVRAARWSAVRRRVVQRVARIDEPVRAGTSGPDGLTSARAPQAQAELDSELRDEVARLVRNFGTATEGATVDAQPPPTEVRLDALFDPVRRAPGTVPPFEFGRALELLRRGATTRAIVPHVRYGAQGAQGVPWYDPDGAPLNTAALFVGVAASLETLGRACTTAAAGGQSETAGEKLAAAELEARRAEAAALFAALAEAPGSALRDDVFGVSVSFYHEFEECFGSVAAMCRALIRTGALYDAGPRADRLHRHAFPLPGGWLRLELTTPIALRFAWDVFELQTLVESAACAGTTDDMSHRGADAPSPSSPSLPPPPPRRPPRPGRHLMPHGAVLPAAALSDATLELFLSPAVRSIYACPELEPSRNALSGRFQRRGAAAARRLMGPAIRLLKACGRLSLDAAAPALALWSSCVTFPGSGSLPVHLKASSVYGHLQLPLVLRSLGVETEEGARALLPPPPLLCQLILADIDASSGTTPRWSAHRSSLDTTSWLSGRLRSGCFVSCFVPGSGVGGTLWAQVMAAAPPLRRALLRAATRLPFELVRRRDAARLRQLLDAEPRLVATLRDGGDDDLLRRACATRGATHQIVASMLRSGAFVACGGGGVVGSGGSTGEAAVEARAEDWTQEEEDRPQEGATRGEAPPDEVLSARFACLAAARAVRNRKTLQVLHAAWGPLLEVCIVVLAPDDGGAASGAGPGGGGSGDGVRPSLRLTLALHSL